MKWSLLFACACSFTAQAQVFTPLDAPPAEVGVAGPRPVSGRLVSIDLAALRTSLADAPDEQLGANLDTYGLRLALPDPTGISTECFVARSPVMDPGLGSRFADIQTYIVRSVDGSASGRFELAPRGMTAMIRTPVGVWMTDPWQSADPEHAVVYWLRDLPGGGDWSCETRIGAPAIGIRGGYKPRTTQTLRTYRLAMACTGEYGLRHCTLQGHAPNIADPLAAIVTVVARTNVVYEADLGVHFNLVANNDQIIFVDPTTDPYDASCDGGGGTDCSGNYLGQNINTLEAVIGGANFEIGHLVTRVFGGVAYLGAVCQGYKAGGISGIPRGGDVDPFSALVVIHEMGHQFGGNHTFSGTRGRCLGNVSTGTAWEAGSGSSPLAYAGGCPVGDAPPSDNIVQFADPFFHRGSIAEMQNFLNGGGSTCVNATPTANQLPEITFVTPDQAIPPGTPFQLTVAATDANGDPLTYSWEQLDTGYARPLSGAGSEDNGIGSLFRIFPPVSEPVRTFPRMADVLSGIPTPGEQLPTTTGVIRQFGVIARDNYPGAGGVALSRIVNLRIAENTTPFTVISPAAGAILLPGQATVQWTVGGTSAAPISCTSVSIKLSSDGGANFTTNLGTFPNTGSASVTLPDIASSTARIRIDAVNGIFFAVSRGFTIRGGCIADINQDGGVDGSDVEAFYNLWSSGDSGGDLNLDGGVDGGDVEFFFHIWEAGC